MNGARACWVGLAVVALAAWVSVEAAGPRDEKAPPKVEKAPGPVIRLHEEKGRVTVVQNGTVVQNNTEIQAPTGIQYDIDPDLTQPGPIVLQDHGTAVRFRNIWILPLPEKGSDRYEPQ